MRALESLTSRRLVLVTGKGGVGKSVLSAAVGLSLHRRGRRILVVEVDPRESVHQMLGLEPSGGDLLTVEEGLHLQNLQPRTVLDRLVSDQVRFEWLAERVRRSPVYHHFVEGAPGLKELAVLGHCLLLVKGEMEGAPEIDTVVLDAPATGHGVSLLAAPSLVSEVIRHGPFGRMSGELAQFVSDPEEAGVVVVTLAEEMPVTEALELRSMLLEKAGRAPELLVVNGLYPAVPKGARPDSSGIDRLWRDRRRVNERELSRLTEAWPGERVELPQLPLSRGPELVQALAERLERLSGAAVGAEA